MFKIEIVDKKTNEVDELADGMLFKTKEECYHECLRLAREYAEDLQEFQNDGDYAAFNSEFHSWATVEKYLPGKRGLNGETEVLCIYRPKEV